MSEFWTTEVHRDIYEMKYKSLKKLYSQKSEYQQVDVVETKGYGKMLLNDGLVMVTERDEFVYHDMIAHPALFVHPNPKKVLVIGGGDGGTAREVLRHKGVEKCVMVEIDELVVNACKEFIPQTSCVFDNPRLELIIGDGVEYVANTKEKFDVILVDSTDPIGPATPLFGVDFYKNINLILNDDGIVISQAESPYYEVEAQTSLLKVLNQVFQNLFIYNFSNLTYPGGLWSFSFATKKYHPIEDFNEARVKDSELSFQYYNPRIHRSSFSLPQFMLNNCKGLIKN
ncbi:MAG: polyamine aminopropyltransferase [Bacteriovoracaceae bacterium]